MKSSQTDLVKETSHLFKNSVLNISLKLKYNHYRRNFSTLHLCLEKKCKNTDTFLMSLNE